MHRLALRLHPAVGLSALVASLPLVGALAAVARGPWAPVADNALISLRADDVLTRANPLVGVYSRFGWNHPGPALFVTLSPFQEVLGTRGLIIGAGMVGTAALAGSMWLLWRRGGAPLVTLFAVAVIVLILASGSDLVDPWNPYIAVLPLFLLVVVAWSVLDGDRWLFPLVVGIGSWLVQVHLGYGLLAAVLFSATLVATLRRRPLRSVRAELAVATAVGIVFWVPPLFEQVTSSPGNLQRILDMPTTDPVGLSAALGIAAQQVAIPRGWLLGDERLAGILGSVDRLPAWWLLLPLGVWVAAGIAVERRAEDRQLARSALRLQGLVGGLVVAGIVSIARIQGLAFAYLVRWQWIIAMVLWTSALWSVIVSSNLVGRAEGTVALRATERRVLPWLAGVLAGAVLVVAAISVAGMHPPDEQLSDTVAAVLDPVARSVATDRVVRIRSEGEYRDELRNGIGAALERRGVAVQYPHAAANRVGAHRARSAPVDSVLVVSVGEWLDRRLQAAEPPVLVHDPLTASERSRLDRLDAQTRRALEDAAAGRRPANPLSGREESLQRRLAARGPRFGVFREVSVPR